MISAALVSGLTFGITISMMPFSSIVAGILSVLVGMDELSVNLVLGAILGLMAMIICAFGDIMSDKNEKSEIQSRERNNKIL